MAKVAIVNEDKVKAYFEAKESNPTSGTNEEVSKTPVNFKVSAVIGGEYNGKPTCKVKGVNNKGKNIFVSVGTDTELADLKKLDQGSEQAYTVQPKIENGRNWRLLV